jgi:hypothetical protein
MTQSVLTADMSVHAAHTSAPVVRSRIAPGSTVCQDFEHAAGRLQGE